MGFWRRILSLFRPLPKNSAYLRERAALLTEQRQTVAAMGAGERWWAAEAERCEYELRRWRRWLASTWPHELDLRTQVASIIRSLERELVGAQAGRKRATALVRGAEGRLSDAIARLQVERRLASAHGDVSWLVLDTSETEHRAARADADLSFASHIPDDEEDVELDFLETLFLRREGLCAETLSRAAAEPSSVDASAEGPVHWQPERHRVA